MFGGDTAASKHNEVNIQYGAFRHIRGKTIPAKWLLRSQPLFFQLLNVAFFFQCFEGGVDLGQ